MVNVGNKENPSYLPAEVCHILPGQTIKRRLSPEQTAQMILAACRKPWENANSIIGDGRNVLGLNQAVKSIAVSTLAQCHLILLTMLVPTRAPGRPNIPHCWSTCPATSVSHLQRQQW